MSYKTILVHVDASRHAENRIRVAAQLAAAHEAHLVGAAMDGISRYIYGNYPGEFCVPIPEEELRALTERANAALDTFETVARQEGATSVERRLSADDPQNALLTQARYCDLLVLSQTDPDDTPSRVLDGMAEFLLLNTGRPLLLVPRYGDAGHIGRHPLVAWDGSRAATRAIADAMPLLRRAGKVTLAIVDPRVQYDVHGEQPGADIGLYLARHGVEVEVTVRGSGTHKVGDTLLALASELRSDLLVMGGYGHMRLREVLLGGVSRDVLRTATLPVLIAH